MDIKYPRKINLQGVAIKVATQTVLEEIDDLLEYAVDHPLENHCLTILDRNATGNLVTMVLTARRERDE